MLKKQILAYKTLDRPLYEPEDTAYILNEVRVLAKFPNIAQIKGLVVSENTYKTSPSTVMPYIITRFLLKYYSGGTLGQALVEDCSWPYRSEVL